VELRRIQIRLIGRRAAVAGLALCIAGAAAGLVAAATHSSAASAATEYGPPNTQPPTIAGTPQEGQTLTASPGTWGGSGLKFTYQWQRCDQNGGSCADVSSATATTYRLQHVDAGNTLRISVTATDSSGASASAVSVPTAVIAALPQASVTGCPAGKGTAAVAQLTSPARLNIDRFSVTPHPIQANTTNVVATLHVSDTCNQSVSGALVYVTPVPYNQFSIPREQATDANGNVTLQLNRQTGFPAANRQQLLVLFARARKPGDPVLAGVSTRRLISTPVQLGQ